MLEYVDSPHRTLRQLAGALHDDGILLIAVPLTNAGRHLRFLSARFRGYLAVDHVNFFTTPTLRMTVERAGFEVMEITTGFGSLADRLLLWMAPACLLIARKREGWEYHPKATRTVAGRKEAALHHLVA